MTLLQLLRLRGKMDGAHYATSGQQYNVRQAHYLTRFLMKAKSNHLLQQSVLDTSSMHSMSRLLRVRGARGCSKAFGHKRAVVELHMGRSKPGTTDHQNLMLTFQQCVWMQAVVLQWIACQHLTLRERVRMMMQSLLV